MFTLSSSFVSFLLVSLVFAFSPTLNSITLHKMYSVFSCDLMYGPRFNSEMKTNWKMILNKNVLPTVAYVRKAKIYGLLLSLLLWIQLIFIQFGIWSSYSVHKILCITVLIVSKVNICPEIIETSWIILSKSTECLE